MSKRIDDLKEKINFHDKVAGIATIGFFGSGAGMFLSALAGAGLDDPSKLPAAFAVMGGCTLATFLSGAIADKNMKKSAQYGEMLSKETKAQEVLGEREVTVRDFQEMADIANKHQSFVGSSRAIDDFFANNDANIDVDSLDM